MKLRFLFFIPVILCVALAACNSEVSRYTIMDQSGTFLWAGHPAFDGGGLQFVTSDTTYGIIGSNVDYPDFFDNNFSSVQIVADVQLTGEVTVRGWGSRFPEARLLNIRPVDKPAGHTAKFDVASHPNPGQVRKED